MSEFMTTKGGNPARDQKVITTPQGKYLKSYNSLVAYIGKDGTVKVGPHYNYSQTTVYYVGKFLDSTLPQIRKDIQAGRIKEELRRKV